MLANYDKLRVPIPHTIGRLIETTNGFTGRGVVALSPSQMERIKRLCENRDIADLGEALEASIGAMLDKQEHKGPAENFQQVTGLTIVTVSDGENYIAAVPLN